MKIGTSLFAMPSTTDLLKGSSLSIICVLLISLAANHSEKKGDDNLSVSSDLIKQCLQWIDMAAQDQDPIVRWQHLTMSKAYLNAARHVASDSVIEKNTRTHVRNVSKRIEQELQNTMNTIYKSCQKLRPQVQIAKSNSLPGDKKNPGTSSKRVTWM